MAKTIKCVINPKTKRAVRADSRLGKKILKRKIRKKAKKRKKLKKEKKIMMSLD